MVHDRASLYVFEKETGYGKCEIVLETNGEVISQPRESVSARHGLAVAAFASRGAGEDLIPVDLTE